MPDAKRRVWMRGRGGSAAALRCRLTTAVEPATPSTLVADRHVLATSLRLVLGRWRGPPQEMAWKNDRPEIIEPFGPVPLA